MKIPGKSDPYALAAGQRQILQDLAEGAPLRASLEAIVRLVERQAEGMLCSILLLDAQARSLRHATAPSLPAEYLKVLDGSSIGPAAGSCGSAAFRGESVVVEDIATHPYWGDYKHLALSHGLLACWSSPIFDRERHVLGTFAMYYAERRGPADEEKLWVEAATHLASIAIVHERQEATRRELVRQLECSEQRFRAVIEHTPNVAIQWYDESGRVLYCNQASERLFGWDASKVKGRTLAELNFSADATARFMLALREVARTGAPAGPMEFEFRHPDGTLGVLLSTVFQILQNTGDACFACMDVDLTEPKRMEKAVRQLEVELHQSQRLRALGTLVGGVAHDFNNLIAAISGHAELALGELPERHAAREGLDEVLSASRRATALVRQLLTYSRREEPKRQPLELRPLIEEAFRLLRPSFPAAAALDMDLAGDTPTVCADATQIHQVLMNLGTNALYAIGQHQGRIRVTSREVSVGSNIGVAPPELEEGRYAYISVSDTGCGMDAATLARVFEPFFTTKGAGRGTGLGLSVVHGIMAAHEGAVRVTSHSGQGTTFELYFPVARPAGLAAASEAPQPAVRGARVLFVDDEEALVFLAVRMLRRAGHETTGYSDPAQALDDFRVRSTEFDVVIADLSMPGLSGLDLARELLLIRPELPVILTSGYIRNEDAESVTSLGARALVHKPNTMEEFVQVLSRVLKNH